MVPWVRDLKVTKGKIALILLKISTRGFSRVLSQNLTLVFSCDHSLPGYYKGHPVVPWVRDLTVAV